MVRAFSRAAVLFVLVLVVVAMLVPNTVLALVREAWPWLSQSMGEMERIWPAIDLAHVVAFAVLGFAGGLALPRLGLWRSMAALALVSVSTEILQFWVPGRSPLASDAAMDMLGGLLGYAVATVLAWPLRRRP